MPRLRPRPPAHAPDLPHLRLQGEGVVVDIDDFDQLANYPQACRERFMAATRPGHVESKRAIDRILDDFLLWMEAFGDLLPDA